MNLIVNVDKNWAIGKDNSLLISIPEDMKFFRRMTVGNVIVMGRRTLESFPGARPLPDRTNIILSGKEDYEVKGATVCHNEDELFEKLQEYDSGSIFIVGGESVYRQFAPYCKKAYVTKTDFEYDADAFCPNLDEDPEWTLVEEGEEQTCFDISFTWNVYENSNVKALRSE